METGYAWEITADGSPTLRTGGDGESMHHSGGALEETLMIYGEPVREVFSSTIVKPRVFSVGLGLGYVELVSAAFAIRAEKSFEMLTLESVKGLVWVFDRWLRGELPPGELQVGMSMVSDLVSKATEVPAERLRSTLRSMRDSGEWSVGGALSPEQIPSERFHAILYDVFSAKTNPELWTEEFLRQFADQCAEARCLFSTYACTGNLKRALRSTGFEVIQRDGFKGKRHSTLGRREL